MLAGIAFAALALVLPFARFPVIGAVDGFGADAWPALIPLAPAVLVAVLGDRTQGVRPLGGTISLMLACGGLVFAVVKVADAFLATRDIAGSSFEAGAPVLVAAVATVVAGAALALRSPTG